jgi:hypothetical protein
VAVRGWQPSSSLSPVAVGFDSPAPRRRRRRAIAVAFDSPASVVLLLAAMLAFGPFTILASPARHALTASSSYPHSSE